VEFDSTPEGAEVQVDGRDTGMKTPAMARVRLGPHTAEFGRNGYQVRRRDFTVGPNKEGRKLSVTLRTVAKYPPGLKLANAGAGTSVATTFYRDVVHPSGLATGPDGSVLVGVAASEGVPAGVYVAREGHDLEPSDAYAPTGPPFSSPGGVLVHPDGRVVVAEGSDSTIWVIRSAGSPPKLLTDKIPRPCGVLIAPATFRGPNVNPGDILVCSGGSNSQKDFGLYAIDQQTGKTRLVAGAPALEDGLLCAAFGPDGKLYAMEDDSLSRNGITIVTISPSGEVAPFVKDPMLSPQPAAGPMAVNPVTGDVFYAYGSRIRWVPRSGSPITDYAIGGGGITALRFSQDGASLFVSDAGSQAQLVAKISPALIEGRLLISGWSQTRQPEDVYYYMEGDSGKIREVAKGRDLSPLGDQVCYYEYRKDDPPISGKMWTGSSDIWRMDLDGGRAENLSQRAGLKGISCFPIWSPDGRHIAFRHCEPTAGVDPCNAGIELWVIDADGSEAHRVAGEEPGDGNASERFLEQWWSPQGDRLLYRYGEQGQVYSVRIDGTDRQQLSSAVFSGNLSPDGAKIADEWTEAGTGGVWRQLRLANSDGSDARVLVQVFVRDDDALAHLAALNEPDPKAKLVDLRTWVGPRRAKWSPKGDQIAFLAAMPFEPDGPVLRHYSTQVEVWICDLSTGVLTRATSDDVAETALSWRGPNTYPGEHPTVTVGNVTVEFATVTKEGVTTVTSQDTSPTPLRGYRFRGRYYDITTTARYSGPVEITVTYPGNDSGGEPPSLFLYDSDSARWKDITTRRDVGTRTVSASRDRL
jgi:hypothetical protein